MHFMAFYAIKPLLGLSQYSSRRGSFDPHNLPGSAPDEDQRFWLEMIAKSLVPTYGLLSSLYYYTFAKIRD